MPDEKSRHEKLHEAEGVYINSKTWQVFVPYSNQPPCEVCGQPRGTPMPKGLREFDDD